MITICTRHTVLLFYYLPLTLPVLLFAGCRRSQFTSPPNYNLNNPVTIKLPSELDDISGIVYYPKDNSLFAESDEKGCLYKIFLNRPDDIRKWKFSHKKDYEDLALLDSIFYVLNSNGDIVSLHFTNDSIEKHEFKFPENGSNEFESLYYDDKLHKFVLICKECDLDKEDAVSSYTFDPQQQAFASFYTIDAQRAVGNKPLQSPRLKPSGAAINPVTDELYILASSNKMLVVADRNGKLKNVYHLNPKIFNQPEGIAFTPSGNMFISNEAGSLQPADILYYSFKKGEQ